MKSLQNLRLPVRLFTTSCIQKIQSLPASLKRSASRWLLLHTIQRKMKKVKMIWINLSYLPKIQNHSIGKIAIVVDTSGSTFGFLDLFHNTVLNIITSLGLTALIICCDDRVQNTFELTPQTLDLIKTSYTGCGGTEFSPPFKWILDNEITIDGLIYLTDGYGECKIPEPEYPVLWVSTDNINFANFGKFIKIHKK